MDNSRLSKIIAVVNRKGGVGKTTTAVNLAHGLSRRLMRTVAPDEIDHLPARGQLIDYGTHFCYLSGHVLLIDFDPQGHCARALGVEPQDADLGSVLLGSMYLNKAVLSADRADEGLPRPNLWLLPASDNLEVAKEELRSRSFEYILSGQKDRESWLLTILEQRLWLAAERFNYIVMDCAPGLDLFAHALYHFADTAVVPVKPDYLSMAGTGQKIKSIREGQMRGIDIKVQVIVPTFAVDRQRLDQELIDQLRADHGELVSDPIPRSQMVAEATAHRQTIFEYDPGAKNPATIAYQRLVDRVYDG